MYERPAERVALILALRVMHQTIAGLLVKGLARLPALLYQHSGAQPTAIV